MTQLHRRRHDFRPRPGRRLPRLRRRRGEGAQSQRLGSQPPRRRRRGRLLGPVRHRRRHAGRLPSRPAHVARRQRRCANRPQRRCSKAQASPSCRRSRCGRKLSALSTGHSRVRAEGPHPGNACARHGNSREFSRLSNRDSRHKAENDAVRGVRAAQKNRSNPTDFPDAFEEVPKRFQRSAENR